MAEGSLTTSENPHGKRHLSIDNALYKGGGSGNRSYVHSSNEF